MGPMGQRMAGSPDQIQVAADEQPTEARSMHAMEVAAAASHNLVGDISAARMAISLASSTEVDTDKSAELLADASDLLEVVQEQARATFSLLAALVDGPAATDVHCVGESLANAGLDAHLPHETDVWTSMNPLALTSALKSV